LDGLNGLREQGLKSVGGLRGIGFFGVLRCAQNDSKNKQRQEQMQRQQQEQTTADPYGMTNKRTDNKQGQQ
jgi:hypothetical protein